MQVVDIDFASGLEYFGRDLVHDVLGPGLDVLGRAALDEQHESMAAETAREVARLHLLAQQAREVGKEVLAGEYAKFLVQARHTCRVRRRRGSERPP